MESEIPLARLVDLRSLVGVSSVLANWRVRGAREPGAEAMSPKGGSLSSAAHPTQNKRQEGENTTTSKHARGPGARASTKVMGNATGQRMKGGARGMRGRCLHPMLRWEETAFLEGRQCHRAGPKGCSELSEAGAGAGEPFRRGTLGGFVVS